MAGRLAVLGLISLTLLAAVGRLFVPHRDPSLSGTYQALAHLFVGGLIGAWVATKFRSLLLIGLAVFLTSVEIAAFVLRLVP